MHQKNALLIFSKTPQIARDTSCEPFSALPWEDLDALYTACVGDVVKNAASLPDVDIFLHRDRHELSDDFFAPFRQRIRLLDLTGAPLADQIQRAVDDVFVNGYHRVVVLLDNHPLLTQRFLRTIFDQLGYEDDCFVVGPTMEGKCYFIGMNMNHSGVFDTGAGDPLQKPNLLMKKLCSTEALLFVTGTTYNLDSAVNLMKLKNEIETLDRGTPEFPSRTSEIFKMFDKKYKLKKPVK